MPDPATRQENGSLRDLVVTMPTPTLQGGGPLRTYGVVRAVAAHRPVDLLYAVFGASEPAREYGELERVELHPSRPSRGPRRALLYLRKRLAGVPPDFARGIPPELVTAAGRLAEAPERGRVIADGPVVAAALAPLARRRPVVYNAHNVESSFRHAADRGALGTPAALETFERGLLEAAEESWMVSRTDMERARRIAPSARLRQVPNVIDVEAIEPVARAPGRRRALFVADFTYVPNVTALRFLLDEVLPRVWTKLPDARLLLVGRGLDADVARDERIDYAGFVEDLRSAYAAVDCAVVPLIGGGGSPLKFVEALAYAVPVVATPQAAAGLEATAGQHYLEGAGAERFADQLVLALGGEAHELGARGRRLAEDAYSISVLARALAP